MCQLLPETHPSGQQARCNGSGLGSGGRRSVDCGSLCFGSSRCRGLLWSRRDLWDSRRSAIARLLDGGLLDGRCSLLDVGHGCDGKMQAKGRLLPLRSKRTMAPCRAPLDELPAAHHQWTLITPNVPYLRPPAAPATALRTLAFSCAHAPCSCCSHLSRLSLLHALDSGPSCRLGGPEGSRRPGSVRSRRGERRRRRLQNRPLAAPACCAVSLPLPSST